jgi:hypothetical protein
MARIARFLGFWKVGLFIIGCALLASQIAGSFIGGNRPVMAFAGMIPLSILVWFQFEDEISVLKLAWATGCMAISALLLYFAIIVPLRG